MGEFTIKDSLVSFESPAVTDVTSAKVYFEPVQEGEGDPSPENVRPITGWTEATLYKTGKNLYSAANGGQYMYLALKQGSVLTASCHLGGKITFYDKDKNAIEQYNMTSISNNRYYITMALENDCYYVRFNRQSGSQHCQLELGAQVTAYEPYKGPILPSKYQEVEYLECTGTQYFLTDIDIQDGLTVDSMQTFAQGSDSYLFGGQGDSATNSKTCFNGNFNVRIQGAYPNSYYLIGTLETDNQTKYHVVSTHANNKRICIVNDVEILKNSAPAFDATTGKCLCFGWNKYGTPSHFYKGKVYFIKVSKADTILANFIPCYRKSDNEPGMYDTVSGTFFTNQGTGEFTIGSNVYYDTIPVSWENEAGTVYGGYVDLAKGEVVEEWKFITLNGDENWQFSSSWSNDSVYCVYDDNSYNDALFSDYNGIYTVCDQLISGSRNACYSGALKSLECISFSGISTAPKLTIKLSKSRVSSVDDVKAYLAEHMPTVAYKLATPITYQLTPQTIKTLKGTNNFWSNTNADTEITYEVADALKMTQIRKNILMSQPHIESATVANPLTFQTDISANLKDCKIYFEPIQEGSGNPSPDNVRPISGWDGVELYINNTSLTIPFPQTIYGGYVDLVKGEVVEEYEKFVLDGVNRWLTGTIKTSDSRGGIYVNYVEAYNYFNNGGLSGMTKPNNLISQWDWKSNRFSVNNSDPGDYAMLQLVGGYPYIRLFIHKSQLGDISDTSHITDSMKAWLSDNPIEMSYKPATPITHQLTDGLMHVTLGQSMSTIINGRSSTGGYANSTATGIDGCKFVYFELGWPTEAFLQYSADISRRSEFVSDSRVLINGTTTDAKLGEMVISTGSSTDYDGDALVYLYVSVPSDCTDLASKRSYLAEHPIKITYPKKTLIPYTVDLTDLKPVKGTNNIWSNGNGNIEIKFWKH